MLIEVGMVPCSEWNQSGNVWGLLLGLLDCHSESESEREKGNPRGRRRRRSGRHGGGCGGERLLRVRKSSIAFGFGLGLVWRKRWEWRLTDSDVLHLRVAYYHPAFRSKSDFCAISVFPYFLLL